MSEAVVADVGFENEAKAPLALVEVESAEQGILFDERMITRDEALAAFLTPTEGCEAKKPTREKFFINGKTEYCFVNPRSSFIAPQIRDSYDPRRIVRTGRSIRDSEDGQLQNCGVAVIDPENIEQYLTDLNEYFGSNVEVNDLTLHPKLGSYMITVFGHNRQLGIASANIETNGHPDVGVLMAAKVFRNPSFWRVIEAQAVENTGESPAMWDRARSIVMYKKLRNRDGVPPTQDEVAGKFNVDRDQIWRAERYDALPGGVKDLVMAKQLPYSASFELDALIPAYGEEYVVDLASQLADRKASGPQIMEAIKVRSVAVELTPAARSMIEDNALTFPQAVEVVKLNSILNEDGINHFIAWIGAKRPDVTEIRKRVRQTINDKISGKVSIFEQEDKPPEEVEAMAKQIQQAELHSMIQQTMSEITRHLTGMRSVVNAGLLGDLADLKPMLSASPDHLYSILEDAATKEDDLPSISNVFSLLKSRINGSNPGLTNQIDEVLDLLNVAAAESALSQRKRRDMLGAISVHLPRNNAPQESLF